MSCISVTYFHNFCPKLKGSLIHGSTYMYCTALTYLYNFLPQIEGVSYTKKESGLV